MGFSCNFKLEYSYTIPAVGMAVVANALKQKSFVRKLRRLKKKTSVNDESLGFLIKQGEKKLTLRSVMWELLKDSPVDGVLYNQSWSKPIGYSRRAESDGSEAEPDTDDEKKEAKPELSCEEVSRLLEVDEDEFEKEERERPEVLAASDASSLTVKPSDWKISFEKNYSFYKGGGSHYVSMSELTQPDTSVALHRFVVNACNKHGNVGKSKPKLSNHVSMFCSMH